MRGRIPETCRRPGDRADRQVASRRLLTAGLMLLLAVACARVPTETQNNPPQISTSIQTAAQSIHPGETITFTIQANDPDGDTLTADWQASCGTILTSCLDSARWQAPDSTQPVRLICRITDPAGDFAADTAWFDSENRDPLIQGWRTGVSLLLNGNSAWFAINAVDPDSQTLTYDWETSCGSVLNAAGDSLHWLAPDTVAQAWICAVVEDGWGGDARDTMQVEVYRELGCAWICNQGAGEIVKLSSLGAELLRVQRFQDPVALAVDAENRRLWVSDREAESLYLLDFEGEVLDSLSAFGRPGALAAVSQNGSCWVADSDSALVRQVASDCATILCTVRGFQQPAALAINPWTGELWVGDQQAGSLHRLEANLPVEVLISDTSLVRSLSGFQLPVDLAVEVESGACWLVDRGGDTVYRLAADFSDSLAVAGFDDPLAVAVTGETGAVWVSDGGSNGTIVKLFYDNIQLEVNGLSWPRALAVDFNDGTCWVPDTQQNRVLRYSAVGELLTTTPGFNYPVDISLNRGY